jgi:hypothetical protein
MIRMLYRHFPKIANKAICILILAPARTAKRDELVETIARAADMGINMIDLGADERRAADIKSILDDTGLRERFFCLISCMGAGSGGLKDFLSTAKTGERDFLLVAPDEDIAREASAARESGLIGHYGFFAPADAVEIVSACDCHDGWEFFSVPYNYLRRDIDGALRYAASVELAGIATDPLAHGRLASVPPGAHEHFRNAPIPRGADEWAFRAVWDRQEIAGAELPGASADQITRVAIYAEAGRANSLTAKELATLSAAGEAIQNIKVRCT